MRMNTITVWKQFVAIKPSRLITNLNSEQMYMYFPNFIIRLTHLIPFKMLFLKIYLIHKTRRTFYLQFTWASMLLLVLRANSEFTGQAKKSSMFASNSLAKFFATFAKQFNLNIFIFVHSLKSSLGTLGHSL